MLNVSQIDRPGGGPGAALPASWVPTWEDFEIFRRTDISPRTLANYREALVDLARFLGFPGGSAGTRVGRGSRTGRRRWPGRGRE
jgi:hypothetical protein